MHRAARKLQARPESLGKAQRDIIALGIAVAAILLFVTTGGTLMPQIVRASLGNGPPPDPHLTTAVLLNIALLLFGITIIVNSIARFLVWRVARSGGR